MFGSNGNKANLSPVEAGAGLSVATFISYNICRSKLVFTQAVFVNCENKNTFFFYIKTMYNVQVNK